MSIFLYIMKYFWLLIMFAAMPVSAQQMEGVVTYERATSYSKIQSRLTFLSEEQKDRDKRTWGDYIAREKYFLYFTPAKSFYTFYTDPKTNENAWNNSDFYLTRDFEKEKQFDMLEMIGKSYIIEDSLRIPKWKIMNQIKEVSGYLCMMAQTEDPIKNQKITAWFAEGLKVPAGPEMYSGLPGMILELDVNDGDLVITAIKVELKPVVDKMILPKKQRGRRINAAEYDRIISQHIKDNVKAHRNPYWTLRY